MSTPRVSFEDALNKFVVKSLLCVGCAACVVTCPFNSLEYVEHEPKLVGECKSCGICAQICPRFSFSPSALERIIFGRERNADETFGIYRRILAVQTTSNDVMKVCQDGGAATSLIIFALENGFVDGAALSSRYIDEPLRAAPKLALSKNEVLQCAGTRYTYSPSLLALKEGIQKRIGRLAFIGTPCQVHAIRKIQALPIKKYSDAVSIVLGLFCSECFTYKGLVENLFCGKLGIEPYNAEKVNIKGKMIVTLRDGESKTIPLKDVKEYACSFCAACPDLSAELADISFGGLGLENWTLTIVRTERGEELVQKAESAGVIRSRAIRDEERQIIELLVKLSKRKYENAVKFLQKLK